MSVGKFSLLLHEAKVGKNDKKWFPKWLRRYAATVAEVQERLPVSEPECDSVLTAVSLQGLRDNGTPAWQRLQAVRAVEMYCNLVLHTDRPALYEIRRTLGPLAVRDRVAGGDDSAVPNEQQLVGRIDTDEPEIIQQMRRELRLRRKARKTEKAYVGWIRRFIGHCGSKELHQFAEPQIKSFLTELAVEGNVAESTAP